jgi:hypothetical protein
MRRVSSKWKSPADSVAMISPCVRARPSLTAAARPIPGLSIQTICSACRLGPIRVGRSPTVPTTTNSRASEMPQIARRIVSARRSGSPAAWTMIEVMQWRRGETFLAAAGITGKG